MLSIHFPLPATLIPPLAGISEAALPHALRRLAPVPGSGRVFTSALTCPPDRRGSDKRRSLFPIRLPADRLADVIGQFVEHVALPDMFDASTVKTAVARVVTAFFSDFNFQNDEGRNASNREPFVVRAHINPFDLKAHAGPASVTRSTVTEKDSRHARKTFP